MFIIGEFKFNSINSFVFFNMFRFFNLERNIFYFFVESSPPE